MRSALLMMQSGNDYDGVQLCQRQKQKAPSILGSTYRSLSSSLRNISSSIDSKIIGTAMTSPSLTKWQQCVSSVAL